MIADFLKRWAAGISSVQQRSPTTAAVCGEEMRRRKMQDFVKIHEDDNVAVALRPIQKGETLEVAGAAVTTLEEITQGHKFALSDIKAG